MILNRLEVECGRIIERMIGHRPAFGRGRSADVPALKIRNLREPTNLAIKQGAICLAEVLAKPEEDTVNYHRVCLEISRELQNVRHQSQVSVSPRGRVEEFQRWHFKGVSASTELRLGVPVDL